MTSHVWPSGGRHLWPSGETSDVQSHARGHLVYAASGVLAVHTERGTSIVPANRVAWTPAGFTHYHRAHGDTDMRIVFLAPSLARLIPDHPAVFLASDLAREVLLALTGPRNYDDAAPDYSRPARARLASSPRRRAPRSTRTATAPAGTTRRPAASHRPDAVRDAGRQHHAGRARRRRSEPAPAPSADCSATNSA